MFTWSLELLNNIWIGLFGVAFIAIIGYHIKDKLEQKKRK